MNSVLIIDSEASLHSFSKIFAEDLENSPDSERFITVDTEFIRENQPKPLLCLIQMATAQRTFVIDSLSDGVDFSSFLSPIFEDFALPKVFHSAAQDIEVLSVFSVIHNVYDTQLYEMLVSCKEQVSYQSLVQKYIGKRIDKTYTVSDWKQRPLSKKQLRYSVGDVTFLRDIYKAQTGKLEQLGRLHWLEEEMQELEAKSAPNSITPSGAEVEEPEDAATAKIEQELLSWIDKRAQEKKIRPENIAGQRSVAKICRKGKGYINKLLKYRGLKNRDLRDFLLFAKNIVPHSADAGCYFEDHNGLEIKSLRLILEIVSKNNEIAQSLISTTDDLEDLLAYFSCCEDGENDKRGSKSLRCLKGWRYEVFGKYAEAFLQKKLSIAVLERGNVGFKTEN